MGSRPFLSLADVAVAGHTKLRPDRACGASAPTQSMKLSEVKRKSNQRKKELFQNPQAELDKECLRGINKEFSHLNQYKRSIPTSRQKKALRDASKKEGEGSQRRIALS